MFFPSEAMQAVNADKKKGKESTHNNVAPISYNSIPPPKTIEQVFIDGIV